MAMDRTELTAYVKSLLGVDKVAIEVSDATIDKIIDDGFNIVQSWYEEVVLETVNFKRGADSSIYFEVGDFTKSFKYPVEIYRTVRLVRSIIDIQRQLLGLDASLLEPSNVIEFSAWRMVRPQLQTALGDTLAYKYIPPKLYISGRGYDDSRFSVEYCYLLEDIEDIGFPPAERWLRDFVLAKAKTSLSAIRGKFKGGGINFDLDSADLSAQGTAELEKLMAELPNLQWNVGIERD